MGKLLKQAMSLNTFVRLSWSFWGVLYFQTNPRDVLLKHKDKDNKGNAGKLFTNGASIGAISSVRQVAPLALTNTLPHRLNPIR